MRLCECVFPYIAWTAILGVIGLLLGTEATRPQLPNGVRVYKDITYRRNWGRKANLDVYVTDRPSARLRPAVVAIHGGGWRGGTKNGYGREIAKLVRHGFVVVSVDYALSSPGHPTWPENLQDVREAVRWVRRNAEWYGVDQTRIAAIGSSAGGHLAAMLGTNAAEDDGASRVDAVVNLYGPTDLVALWKSSEAVEPLRLHLGTSAPENPSLYALASPIAYVSAASSPMLLIHGEIDALVPVAQSITLAERLRTKGVAAELIVVPGVGHAFGLEMPGRDLTPEVIAFLDRSWPQRPRPGP